MPLTRHPRSGAVTRRAFRLVATMLVGVQFAATADLLLTPHSLCPEHGEVVRLVRPTHPAHPPHSPLPAGLSESHPQPEQVGMEHVHALFKTPARGPLVVGFAVAARVVVVEQEPVSAAAAQVLAPLTVAPKGSPPG